MIIDVFTYFNETDVVDLRMKVLDGLVDQHIAIQASQTFTGEPRERVPLSHIPRLTDVYIDFPREDMTPWEREIYQRNYCAQVLLPDAEHILIADADEIPNPETVLWCIESNVILARLDVDQYFWNLNWKVPDHMNSGGRPIMVPGPALMNRLKIHHPAMPHDVRGQINQNYTTVNNGGWHFSFLGTPDKIRDKIEAFSHTEYDSEEYKDAQAMQNRVLLGIDPFDRFPLKYTHISSETHPKWVVEHQDEVAHLIGAPPD